MNPQERITLEAEFTKLRNSQMKRPATSNTRAWAIYCDHLNDTDQLARAKSNSELTRAVERMKSV